MSEKASKIHWVRVLVEGVVIVGSILLAFGIEAWWEERVEDDLEQRHLVALLAEFEQNGQVLLQAREVYESRYMEAIQLLQLMERNPTEIDGAEFDELLRGLMFKRSFHLESGAYDGLIASGELALIRDEKLRGRLAAWPSYVVEWSEEDAAIFSFVDEWVLPLFSDRIRIRGISSDFPSFPDGDPPPPVPLGSTEAVLPALISRSVQFDNLVFRRAQSTWHAMRDGETLRAQLSTIVGLIRQNLD